GRAATVRAAVTLPGDVAPGTYRLVACADDLRKVRERDERNNCARARGATVVATTPVSGEAAIAADLAARRISPERALVLRVQSVFGDPALPARYQGDAGVPADDAIVREASDRWPRLSKSARRTLLPFLLPPAARGSWYDRALRPEAYKKAKASADAEDRCDSGHLASDLWTSVPAAGGKLRFWYLKERPADRKIAEGYVRDIGLTAYPRLKKLFGRDLPSDAGAKCYHGPDGAYDIYIVDNIAGRLLGVTIPSEQSPKNNKICDGTSSFIGVVEDQPRWVLTHELFHAFQFTYPYSADHECSDYLFWDESTATWGAQWVWPLDDYEHGHRFLGMVENPETPLEGHDYGGWAFPLHLERTLGEQAIPATYAQFATAAGPITGIDAAIGGFDKVWKDFTKKGYNHESVAPSFMAWDRLPNDPGFWAITPLTLGGAHAATVAAKFGVPQLARMYMDHPVADAAVKEIVFNNTAAGQEGAILWAQLTLADGTQRVEDWTDRKEIRLCRDDPAQNVQDIVLMEGNSEWRSDRYRLEPDPQPSFALRDTCDDGPLRYQVLSASISSTTSGAKSVNQYCGSVSGTTTFGGSVGAQPYDSTDAVLPVEGRAPRVHGVLGVTVPATFNYVLHGCDDDKHQCDTAFSRELGGGGFGLTVDVEADSAGAKEAKLVWSIPDPSIGFVDYGPEVCNVFDFFVGLDPGDDTQTIPMDRLRAKGPITLTIEGGPKTWSIDGRDEPATLTYGWKYSITVQRVDEAGQPLR
ncbi:MAG TPA: hypothetical protein VNT55_06795, partial [Baekduia sp.]|nr:hypothetical protein [Baekduia sp.]